MNMIPRHHKVNEGPPFPKNKRLFRDGIDIMKRSNEYDLDEQWSMEWEVDKNGRSITKDIVCDELTPKGRWEQIPPTKKYGKIEIRDCPLCSVEGCGQRAETSPDAAVQLCDSHFAKTVNSSGEVTA